MKKKKDLRVNKMESKSWQKEALGNRIKKKIKIITTKQQNDISITV